jgi:hypothetical protein
LCRTESTLCKVDRLSDAERQRIKPMFPNTGARKITDQPPIPAIVSIRERQGLRRNILRPEACALSRHIRHTNASA